jgi:DNA-binding transcriptional LysR family regulator
MAWVGAFLAKYPLVRLEFVLSDEMADLPRHAIAESLSGGELVEVLPGVISVLGHLYVVYPSLRHVPSAVTAFVDMASERWLALMESPKRQEIKKRQTI